MNYLAHVYLSGPLAAHRVGGLLGDFVKGPLRGERPAEIEQGITLHRAIDSWVDRQTEVAEFHQFLPPAWRRYAGIVCDIYFDHLLANHWALYHTATLDSFCGDFYSELNDHFADLPPAAQHFARTAPRVGWLQGYRKREHLPIILQRVGQRFKKPVALEQLLDPLSYNSAGIEKSFFALFPRLIDYSAQQRQNLTTASPH